MYVLHDKELEVLTNPIDFLERPNYNDSSDEDDVGSDGNEDRCHDPNTEGHDSIYRG